MKRREVDLFDGLPRYCNDDKEGKRLLITVHKRLTSIDKTIYNPSKRDGSRYYFIFDFYKELRYGNYQRAYGTLRYMSGIMNLCSSEIIEILSTTIGAMTEE